MNQPINYVAPMFPTPAGTQHNDGMTLRDYFAAAALTGYLGNPEGNSKWEISDVAQFCYRQADAMIRAREAK